MLIRKTAITYYGRFVLLYLLILIACAAVVGGVDNMDFLKGASSESGRELNLFEIILYVIYQYILNFPLSIFNWFSERYLYTTFYFILPNALMVGWLISWLTPYRKKEINKVLMYVLIPFGLLTFIFVGYAFISAVFAAK